jgi:hypothetical protein
VFYVEFEEKSMKDSQPSKQKETLKLLIEEVDALVVSGEDSLEVNEVEIVEKLFIVKRRLQKSCEFLSSLLFDT